MMRGNGTLLSMNMEKRRYGMPMMIISCFSPTCLKQEMIIIGMPYLRFSMFIDKSVPFPRII